VSSWRACPRWRDGLELTTPNGASCGSTAPFRASWRDLATAHDDWQYWRGRFGRIRNGMIRLFQDRATWQTILAMLHKSVGVVPGSFGDYRLGSLHQQHPHRHPPGDRADDGRIGILYSLADLPPWSETIATDWARAGRRRRISAERAGQGRLDLAGQ
jgi:hypothetical protein